MLARGWIDAVRRLHPATGELAGDPREALSATEHWTVEILLKLGCATP